jgi:2-isopropylmalate synthase
MSEDAVTKPVTGSVQRPSGMPAHRYHSFTGPDVPDRQWPTKRLRAAPLWCSVDLRDGNQALVEPMDIPRKRRLFALLARMGYKEIEVGFPSSSQIEFDFVRELIEEDLIPGDVTIQVITQARPELIERSFDAIEGVPRAIVHLYNSVSPLQRRVVFNADRQQIVDLAVGAARQITDLADGRDDGSIIFEYSPESFTATEFDYSLEICEAVMQVWQPGPDRPMIINLPATVECTTANGFADLVEWMNRNLSHREHICLSVHPHNDRGTGVAAAEFALMAGAERVEGCLFGNGERTGNVDLVTLGMNLFSHGIDPMIDFSDLEAVKRLVIDCTRLPVHPRHPYAGELVYTAFSGSHQDAIKKGLDALDVAAATAGLSAREVDWEVPYLPIDPKDVGRTYEAVIRVNSQSGKAGVAYLLRSEFGLDLPRPLQIEFCQVVQQDSEDSASEVRPERLWELFAAEYLREGPHLRVLERTSDSVDLEIEGSKHHLAFRDTASFVEALRDVGLDVRVSSLSSHDRAGTHPVKTVAYAECAVAGQSRWGVAIDDERHAGICAIVSAVNRVPLLRDVGRPAPAFTLT